MAEVYVKKEIVDGKVKLNRVQTYEVDKEEMIAHLEEQNENDMRHVDALNAKIAVRAQQIINIKKIL